LNIKKYKAKSIKEGIEMVKKDLGPDAVILATNKIDDSEEIEMLAATDLPGTKIDTNKSLSTDSTPDEYNTDTPSKFAGFSPDNGAGGNRQISYNGKNPPSMSRDGQTSHLSNVESQLSELKNQIHLFGKQVTNLSSLIQCSETVNFPPLFNKLVASGIQTDNAAIITNLINSKLITAKTRCQTDKASSDENIKSLLSSLISTSPISLKNGKSEKTKNTMIQEKKASPSIVSPFTDRHRIESATGKDVSPSKYDVPPQPEQDIPYLIAFIGPTGTGKTTTIAKIASNFAIYDKLKVALITIDTYRLAAVEQLNTFAKIIDIPIDVVFSVMDFPNSLEKFKDMDVIFIDTAGSSQKNERYISELCTFFNLIKPDEIHLVLSLTTKATDISDIIKNYDVLCPGKLIFTKLDETSSFGTLLESPFLSKKPISYLTTGQSIPDDIERANSSKIISHIWELKERWEK